MKSFRPLLFAVLALSACDSSGSSVQETPAPVSTFTVVNAGSEAVITSPAPDPVVAPPVQTITELPATGRVEAPVPLPEIGPQFAVSPTDVPYPKLATLYPGHFGPVVEDGMILPWLSNRATLKSSVKIKTAMDTDGDGKKDRIALRVVQPAEVAEGLKTPVIVRPSIYYEDPTYETNARGPFLGEDQYIRSGFTVVYADSLGSNQSDGCPSIMDGTERRAMADVVRWLASDPEVPGFNESGEKVDASGWSTRHVAMEGVSYGGTLPTMAAVMAPPGLEAIVPVDGISSAYDYLSVRRKQRG